MNFDQLLTNFLSPRSCFFARAYRHAGRGRAAPTQENRRPLPRERRAERHAL